MLGFLEKKKIIKYNNVIFYVYVPCMHLQIKLNFISLIHGNCNYACHSLYAKHLNNLHINIHTCSTCILQITNDFIANQGGP